LWVDSDQTKLGLVMRKVRGMSGMKMGWFGIGPGSTQIFKRRFETREGDSRQEGNRSLFKRVRGS